MRAGRVKQPTLPPLLPAAIATPASTPTPLKEALQSVLQTSMAASEACNALINKQNCARSLPEWNAAHDLLVLAITDNQIHSEHRDGDLYFWKNQLYCTVTDLPIINTPDKHIVFNCLHQAEQLNLIHSADAYIQGIHLSQSFDSELSVLKEACIMLLDRLLSLEATIDDLRAAFVAYRQQQLYCNVIAIALKLIPIAGGAVSNALEVVAELCGELSGADVIEYSLSTACAILEECNFSKLPQSKQAQIVNVFEEYGFTMEQVQCLFQSRTSVAVVNIPPALCENISAECTHQDASDKKDFLEGDRKESGTDCCEIDQDDDAFHEVDSVSDGKESDGEQQEQPNINRYDSMWASTEFAKSWTHYVLADAQDREQLFGGWNECLNRLLQREKVSPRTLSRGTSSSISRFTNNARRFVQSEMHPSKMKIGFKLRMVQFVHEYVQQDGNEATVSPRSSQTAMIEIANEWSQFIFGSHDEETDLRSRMTECLVQYLEEHCVCPQSLKFGSTSDIREVQKGVEQFVEDKLGKEMTTSGYYMRLTFFVGQFLEEGGMAAKT
ncbi:hypothetical protein FGB62_45g130 [Gracilaria domingensis]|nr:hypothetical protein FGB62_45g130 [Gracilaria domingensis]